MDIVNIKILFFFNHKIPPTPQHSTAHNPQYSNQNQRKHYQIRDPQFLLPHKLIRIAYKPLIYLVLKVFCFFILLLLILFFYALNVCVPDNFVAYTPFRFITITPFLISNSSFSSKNNFNFPGFKIQSRSNFSIIPVK